MEEMDYILEDIKVDPVGKKSAQCKNKMFKSYQQNGSH
jgi:hypothetical protein